MQTMTAPTALDAALAAINGQAPKLDNAIRHYLGQVTFKRVHPVKTYTLEQAIEVCEKTMTKYSV